MGFRFGFRLFSLTSDNRNCFYTKKVGGKYTIILCQVLGSLITYSIYGLDSQNNQATDVITSNIL